MRLLVNIFQNVRKEYLKINAGATVTKSQIKRRDITKLLGILNNRLQNGLKAIT